MTFRNFIPRRAGAIKHWQAVSMIAAMALSGLGGAPVQAGSGFMVPQRISPPPSGARSLCGTYSWACAGDRQARLAPRAAFDVVRRVNLAINARFDEISDARQYKKAEYWALPTRKGGDCEDFALAKKQALMKAGVAPGQLLIATALDKKRRSHAVLIYRSERGDLVLDNQTDKIVAWDRTGYIFLRMQDPSNPARWVAGFSQG